MQILQFGEKVGLSRWPLLGRNFREFLGLRSFAHSTVARAAIGRRGFDANHHGAAGREDLVAGNGARPRSGSRG
jgi:hypothetical protein